MTPTHNESLDEAAFAEAFADLFPLTGHAMEVVEYAMEHKAARSLLLKALATEREPLLAALTNLVDTANDKGWEGEQWDEARALIEQDGRTEK